MPPQIERAAAGRGRRPTAEELALWRHAIRGVEPRLPEARPEQAVALPPVPPPAASPPPGDPVPRRATARPRQMPRPSQRLDPLGPVDIDRGSWRRLRRGHYPVEGRLDLHGLTQARAHDALAGFLALSQAQHRRCVLVITGRGALSGGTLRAMTPRWLDEPPNRQRVLAYATAQRHHGGEGAIYVLLRRSG
ncbi:MAG TPA: Smr/MutS family protein [Geminicoccaceae bacterium]|nr:Smr/MutS family protein [Geminicoccus sp.]HMU51588.1 Smr/MutS family protein [Geminicoccaceae bacterium]